MSGQGPAQGAAAAIEELDCPRCHAINQRVSRYCYRCGLPFEGVQPTVPDVVGAPAGFWARLGGHVIDELIVYFAGVALASIVVASAFSEELESEKELSAGLKAAFLGILVGVEAAYHIALLALWGTTPGRRLFNLRVVNTRGGRVGPWRAVARYVSSIVSGGLILTGYLLSAVRADRRTLHDLAAGTRVVVGR